MNNISLIYLAKPIYGGWVTFTVHLSKKYNYPLYKVAKRNETRHRNFGYDVFYKNITLDTLKSMDNLLITAIDKHYWNLLYELPSTTQLVIHDPTELKINHKNPNPLVQNECLLNKFKIYTIRETVQKFILDTYDIRSEYKFHPFYEYNTNLPGTNIHAISISRIDFDKHTDILLKANKLIKDSSKKIQLFGAENRLYVHHKLKDLDFCTYWDKSHRFEKKYPIQYKNKDILKQCKYVVDMSIIKGDGGGTQYTFLEAIYQDCILILHNDWIKQGTLFKHNENCLSVNNEQELADIINNDEDYSKILKNSKQLLNKHVNVKW